MSLEDVEKLVEHWRKRAEEAREMLVQEPTNMGAACDAGDYDLCAEELEAALRAEGQGERWQCSQCGHVNRMEFTICENCKTRAPVRWLTCLGCGLPEPSCTCHPNPANENTAMGRAAAPSLHKEGAGGARCQQRHQETGQCELRAGHEGSHLAGYIMWAPAGRAEQPEPK